MIGGAAIHDRIEQLSTVQKCTKFRYKTRKAAKKEMKLINQNNRFHRFEHKLTEPYWCDMCMCFHLTSLAKQRSRDLTRKKKKK
jgi:hypothetical protein